MNDENTFFYNQQVSSLSEYGDEKLLYKWKNDQSLIMMDYDQLNITFKICAFCGKNYFLLPPSRYILWPCVIQNYDDQ